jgi:hypothetical protein
MARLHFLFLRFFWGVLGLAFVAVPLSAAKAQDLRLIMVEQPGCIYCARWNAELGDIYPKTPEGQAAPLVRVDLRAPPPEGVTYARRVVFTPTFILVRDGRELERLEGYPGEDFFWGLLGVMLKNAGVAVNGT